MPRLLLLLALAAGACTSSAPERVTPVAATALAVDARTVEIRFTESIDPSSVDPSAIRVVTPFARPISELAVVRAQASGSLLTIETGEQRGGLLYAAALGSLRFVGIGRADAPAQINFRGYGRAPVSIRLDARGFVVPSRLDALVTLEPRSGEYSDRLQSVPMTARGDVFTASISARIDPDRIFAARAADPDGREAGRLTRFTVTSTSMVRVDLAPLLPRVPEFLPPTDDLGAGLTRVRIVLDDRPAKELEHPQLRVSVDASGRFDSSLSRLEALARVPGKGRVYEANLKVAVDPDRSLTGTTEQTLPYVVFLVESGQDVQERSATFVVPVKAPQVIVIPIGNPSLVPVKFRVDARDAIVRPDRSVRLAFPGEGLFLTGEFPNAEDALGHLAADAFSGGERTTLELRQRPDVAGIFEKTIFMLPNRPYGWKVVRCPTGVGCATLNRHVISSGRAFPTVQKNLVTANTDAAQSPSIKLIDPRRLEHVELDGGEVASYAGAQVSRTGRETPGTSIMFKQEVPDIVVTVGTMPVTTPIYVIGTWRDVNIPQTPAEISMGTTTIELAMYDYDDGTRGKLPLMRDLALPDDPEAP